jgi:hypothetical protein
MDLIFLHGPLAAGKLTVARELAARTGYALFHNHLVVDAVLAVFPFGSPDFIRLRERYWLDMFEAAARTGRSLVFTFAPEPTVAPDFPERVARLVETKGGRILFVALTLDGAEQERRIANEDRAAFQKLRSVELLRELRVQSAAVPSVMPQPVLTIDTGSVEPAEAAARIAAIL